jgi:hypothetical protein
LLLISGAVASPLSVPLLPVQTYLRYSQRTHLAPTPIDKNNLGQLPQFYADMFGWEEMVQETARFYDSLPPDVRHRTAILCGSYGQAGAVDLYGPKYGLPQAISGHQSYFLWGPRDYSGESVIVIGVSRQELEQFFDSIEPVGEISHPYAMPYNHFTIYYCRRPKISLQQLWPRIKNWDRYGD